MHPVHILSRLSIYLSRGRRASQIKCWSLEASRLLFQKTLRSRQLGNKTTMPGCGVCPRGTYTLPCQNAQILSIRSGIRITRTQSILGERKRPSLTHRSSRCSSGLVVLLLQLVPVSGITVLEQQNRTITRNKNYIISIPHWLRCPWNDLTLRKSNPRVDLWYYITHSTISASVRNNMQKTDWQYILPLSCFNRFIMFKTPVVVIKLQTNLINWNSASVAEFCRNILGKVITAYLLNYIIIYLLFCNNCILVAVNLALIIKSLIHLHSFTVDDDDDNTVLVLFVIPCHVPSLLAHGRIPCCLILQQHIAGCTQRTRKGDRMNWEIGILCTCSNVSHN